MAKITDEFVQFAGHFQSLASEISGRLKKRGHSIVEAVSYAVQPGNEGSLDDLAETFANLLERAKNAHQIIIGGNRTIVEVVAGSGYTDFDRSILERCTLAPGLKRKVTIEIFSIEHFDHDPTDAEVEAEYVRLGLGRPTPDHAIHFGDQKRDLPEDGHPIIFYLRVPVSDASGYRLVLKFWRNGARRRLDWRWLPGRRWHRHYRFAGVRE